MTTTPNKVTLPREVAESIEYIRGTDLTEHALYDYQWLSSDVDDDTCIRRNKDVILRYIDYKNDRFDDRNQLMTYFTALVNGYTVEQTPEERLLERYAELEELSGKYYDTYDSGLINGIKETLDILGIKIEGINADTEDE